MTEPARDPLVDKLIEQFRRPEPPREPYLRFGDRVASSLYGIPIETVAASLREYYLTRIRETLAQISAGSDWHPDDWQIVCPSYLFPGVDVIQDVRVQPTCPFDWAVFITKTPEAMIAQYTLFPTKPHHTPEVDFLTTPIVYPPLAKGLSDGS